MKQVLSIEQMKHLKELEVDTSDASMTWALYPYEENKQPQLSLRKWNTFKEPFRKQHCIPAFTLQDILDKLPCLIKCLCSGIYFNFGKQVAYTHGE